MPVLEYASAHNGAPVVLRVGLRPALMAPVSDVVVRISVSERGRPLATDWQRHLESVPPGGVDLRPDLRLDPAALAQVEEARPAHIVVEVTSGEILLAREVRAVTMVAHNQWLVVRGAEAQSLRLLASFVRPNDPAVQQVLGLAAERLQQTTGSSALQGYQSGAERVDEIVAAIYDTLGAWGINYSNPPAHWDVDGLSSRQDVPTDLQVLGGQKVRTHEQVLRERLGTCLDTTVLFAACLEQVGIAPLIWLPEGHAFVGYWRDERSLAPSVTLPAGSGDGEDAGDPLNLLLNAVDSQVMTVVETTAVTESPPRSFSEAVRHAVATRIKGEQAGFYGVVDVRACRREGIVPTPVRHAREDGTVEVVEYQAAPVVLPRRERPADAASGGPARDVPYRVQQWKNSLLDLSLRNQLINFRATAGSLRLIVPEGSLPFIEDSLHEQQSFSLAPLDGASGLQRVRGIGVTDEEDQALLLRLLTETRTILTDVDTIRYPARLRSLRYKARTIIQESGANSLYLAMGSLVWTAGGKQIRSPLILVPVTLEGGARGSGYRIQLDEAGASTPNFCLLEKLRVELGLEIPQLAEPELDGAGIDVQAVFDAVRRAVGDAGLGFRVDESAELAILQFAKFRLWKDLEDHWPRFAANSLVRHLVDNPTEAYEDPTAATDTASPRSLDDLAASCPIPADSSQLEAIDGAVRGRTFVLEGPPGTGKSQTITNLLARAVAEGLKVMFVAEKRAALDVVKARLDAVGLGPFCLDLHDKGSKPAAIRRQLLDSLQHQPARDDAGREVAEGDLRAAVTALSRYRDRLHAAGSLGMTLHDAQNLLLALGDGPTVSVPESFPARTDAQAWDEARRHLMDLPALVEAAHPRPDHPWILAGPVHFDTLDRQALGSAVRSVAEIVSRLDSAPHGPEVLSALDADDGPTTLQQFVSASLPPARVLDQVADPGWSTDVGVALAQLGAASATFTALQWCTPDVLALPLPQIAAAAEVAAAAGFLSRKKRQTAVLEQLRPGLRPGVTPPLDSLVSLTGELVRAQQHVTVHLQALRSRPGLESVGPVNPLVPGELEPVQRRVAWLEWGSRVAAQAPASPLRTALRSIADDPIAGARMVADLHQVVAALTSIRTLLHVQDDSLSRWMGTDSLTGALRRALPEWVADAESDRFPRLARWIDLNEEFLRLRAVGLESVVEAVMAQTVDLTELAQAASRGVSRAVLSERLASQGLDVFDSRSHERSVQRFAASSAALRSQMVEAIPADLVASRSFDAGMAAGEVGALQRELNKQRRGLPIRALLSRYGNIIGQLTPCLLVSPDSVARFLEPGNFDFDLVVFDEASQIRVAEAVGAMGRARSVVVVGDSKQMPPTLFGGGGLDDEDDIADVDELLVSDEESILTECVQARVPRRWLSWHYRSQDEALIAFSNAQYYEGRLSSFPPPVRAASAPAVSLIRVDGHFNRTGPRGELRTNPREADAVVDWVRRRLAEDPHASIGIVTFNVQQRDLILRLLADCDEAAVTDALERDDDSGLFVKNLENVQGDERDVILFSVAFAKNDRGVLPLNFGPLNRLGGERRLNVAVTRARRQVVVFCSFDPVDLRVESTASLGIAHLRSYLEFAARGPQAVGAVAARTPKATDRHRDSVAEAVRELGWPVRTDVGLSEFRVDLAIASKEDPSRDICALLLDGPGWASRATVGDRDGLPVDVLNGMLKWPHVARIWLPAWLQDRQIVLDTLDEDLREVERRVLHGPPEAPVPPLVEPEPVPASAPLASGVLPATEPSGQAVGPTGQPDDGRPAEPPAGSSAGSPEASARDDSLFVPWTPTAYGTRDQLDSLSSRPAIEAVRAALRDGIAAEGPIHRERLARLTGNAFGLARVRQDRIEAIAALIPTDYQATPDGFVWPAGIEPTSWRGYRRTKPGADRPLEHVALDEIANAMQALTAAAMGIEREELYREALEIFGGRRLTEGLRQRMALAADHGLATGRLVEDGDLLRSAGLP